MRPYSAKCASWNAIMSPNVICARLSRTRSPSQLRAKKAHMLIVTEYSAENWHCGMHGVEAQIGGDQIRSRITLKISKVRKPVQTALTAKLQI
jgi:hypothetical protein